jgi:FkbM family methyltransferase
MDFRLILKSARSFVLRLFRASGSSPISALAIEKAEQTFYIDHLQPGMVVFDVGANIGELSLLFSRFVGPTGSVHSFEANTETFARLNAIIELADRHNIRLNNLAVSDHVGLSKLHVYDGDYSAWTSLSDRPLKNYGLDVTPLRHEDVRTTTIDQYCEEHGIEKVDLLKIDVEGAEFQVLRGAEKMMRQRRIRCCVFEFGQTTFDMGNHPAQIKELLTSFGYELHNVVHNAPIFPGGQSAATAQFSMHICIPKG